MADKKNWGENTRNFATVIGVIVLACGVLASYTKDKVAISENTADIKQNATMITRLQEQVNTKFEKIDTNFEKKSDKLGDTLQIILVKLSSLETKVNSLQNHKQL